MRNLLLSVVGAATMFSATAAMAQSVEFEVGRHHPGFYMRDHDRDHDWRRAHSEWRDRDRDAIVIRRHHHFDRDRFFDRDRD